MAYPPDDGDASLQKMRLWRISRVTGVTTTIFAHASQYVKTRPSIFRDFYAHYRLDVSA